MAEIHSEAVSVWIRWCRTGNQSVRLSAATSSAKPATTSSSDFQPCIVSTSYPAQRDVSVKHVCVLLLTTEVVDMLLFHVTELSALRDFVQVLRVA